MENRLFYRLEFGNLKYAPTNQAIPNRRKKDKINTEPVLP
jgi:hypothetical protein